MNKWIVLIATLFMSIGFSMTIKTTIANPSVSNLVISGALGLCIIAGLYMFSITDKPKQQKDYDGLTPAN
jgi:hypothetical protein